ncbi:MAG: DHH family phosphoesterase [Phycisphaeraceae bacterium]
MTTSSTAMNEYNATIDAEGAARLLQQTAGPVVVLTHAKPDGDAFGSVVALTAALRSLDKSATACFVPPLPENLASLRGAELAEIYSNSETQLPEAALYVVLDTGAWSQVGPMRQYIEPHLDRTLIIDHHLSGDVPAAHRHIDGDAAATCEILAPILEQLLGGTLTTKDETLTRIIHDSLFVGIASDTGWFRFSNTRPRTHELAAKLRRFGVDHAELYRQIEQSERMEKLALLTRALDNLRLLAGGRAAIMALRRADFDETGAYEEETERLIDVPQQVGAIQVIALVSESQGDPDNGVEPATRVSFRSKPGPGAVNVAELAGELGGGGHARAAGAKLKQPLDEALPLIEQAVERALGGAVGDGPSR